MKKETALITGAGNGLGKFLSEVFSERDYNLILTGRDENALEDTIKKLNKKIDCDIIIGDLNKNETIKRLYEKSKERDISVLINNAGVPCPNLPFYEIPDGKIEEIIFTNLLAPIKLTKKIYSIFCEKNYGRILNINSIIALESKKFRSVSTASKRGLQGFSRGLKNEANEKNISIIDVYISRTITKPEYDWGMDARYVAEKIFEYHDMPKLEELIIDGRPLEVRKKENLKRIIIDGRRHSK